ncbi:hypothetical protein SCHPADRAFT_943482 [Schizopora paradoxa]|uniref:Uncharacterized protein n=1 Tax=Schizopora paradoxa TaxID=27342 RepID=A0A0H2RDK8_9AGAM|nr:hypothetical protein SCHPADRAFT_943482 [Schizopora paradoxa]
MDSLIEDLAGDQLLGYTLVSIGTLVSYEYVIMLDNEVDSLPLESSLFLRKRASISLPISAVHVHGTDLLFFVSTAVLHQETCILGFRTSTCIVFIEFLLSILVLFTRAYAVWGGSKRIFYFLVLTYAGVIVGGSISVHLFMSGVGSVPLIGTTGCLVQIANDDLWIALTILILSESLAFGLLLYKSLLHARELKNIDRSETKDILSIMARDGVAYFACNLAITTTNIFLLKSVNPDFQDILIIMQGALENILCGRLLFHIRAVNDSTLGYGSKSRTTLSWRIAMFTKGSTQAGQSVDVNFDDMDDDVPLTASISFSPFEAEISRKGQRSGDVEKGTFV